MKIYLRVKKLRESFGHDHASFAEILFEDFSKSERGKYRKLLPLVENGRKSIDIIIVQQILKKFRRVSPYWLINGEGDMELSQEDVLGKIIIQQIRGENNSQHFDIRLIDNTEAIAQLLAEKDANLKKAYKEIARLRDMIFLANETYLDKINELNSQTKRTFKSVVAVILLVFFTVGSLLSIIKYNEPIAQIVPNKHSLNRSTYYERLINDYRDGEINILSTALQNDKAIFKLLTSIPPVGAQFRIVSFQEEIKFEKLIKSEDTPIQIDISHWKPGIYYCILTQIKDNRIIGIDAIMKD